MDANPDRNLPARVLPVTPSPIPARKSAIPGGCIPSNAVSKNEVRGFRAGGIGLSVLLFGFLFAAVADAASFRTQNFIIDAPSSGLAKAVGEAAERYRDELATYWTGSVLPPWPRPCPVRVIAGANLAAQGVTTYNPAPVRDFQMEVIGTPERILDSVLPHEVSHTVLATYFGRPLPRWADEGICTTVEHISERTKHEVKLREFLSTRRGIPMNNLFRLTEYPPDVLPMYAQGYSVCRFLIEQQGPQTFVNFLKNYFQHPSWTANIQKYYGYDTLAELQEYWLAWVEAGSGSVARFAKREIRSTQTTEVSLASRDIITRDQSLRGSPSRESTSLVAANDHGRVSESDTESGWYHRRASGNGVEELPPGNRVAALERQREPRSASPRENNAPAAIPRSTAPNMSAAPATALAATPTWAPPSVMSSGRYSAATPQPETSGSLRSDPAPMDSRGANDLRPLSNRWR